MDKEHFKETGRRTKEDLDRSYWNSKLGVIELHDETYDFKVNLDKERNKKTSVLKLTPPKRR